MINKYKRIIPLIQYGGTDKLAMYTIRENIYYDPAKYAESKINRLYNLGITRFMHWDMFGHYPNEALQFTAGYQNNTDFMLESVSSVISKYLAEHILYLGQIPKDKILSNLNGTAWINNAEFIITKALAKGFSIALDNCQDFYNDVNSKHYNYLKLCVAIKRKLYFEPFNATSIFTGQSGITVAEDYEKYEQISDSDGEHILMLTGNYPPSFNSPKTPEEVNVCIIKWALRNPSKTLCFNFNDAFMKQSDKEIVDILDAIT